jgi:hypothetical protein
VSDEERPLWAFALSLFAGLLMLVEGVFLSIVGSVASGSGALAVGAVLGGLGFLGALFGVFVVIFAILLFANPDSHVGYGIAILILSLISIVGGGGFILGLALGVIGGILAIIFEPDEFALPELAPVRVVAKVARVCTYCETMIPAGAPNCPNCHQPAVA